MKLTCFVLFSASFALSASAFAQQHTKTISNCTTISEPGSYEVNKVIRATERDLRPIPEFAGVFACILVQADLVTLDLKGYTIIGTGRVAGALGVAGVDRSDIDVRSGKITNFEIALFGQGRGWTVENINASRNGTGIFVTGPGGHRVNGNIANDNSVTGIAVQCPSVVLGNMAHGNASNLVVDPVACTRSHNNPKLGDDVPAP
jgi:hypothetical protein